MIQPESAEAMARRFQENKGLVDEFFSSFELLDDEAVKKMSAAEKQALQDELVYRIGRVNNPSEIATQSLEPIVERFLGTRDFFIENLAGRDNIILGLVSKRLLDYIQLIKTETEIQP